MYKKSFTIVSITLMLLLILTACGGNDAEPVPTLASLDNQNTSVDDSGDADTDDSSSTDSDDTNTDDSSDTSSDTNTDDSDNADAQSSTDTSFDDLAPNTHDLSITGALSSDGTYSGEQMIVSYEPFRSSNTSGQQELEIFADIAPNDLTDETFVIVYVRFPASITPGTYDIQTRDRNSPELVQGFVTFDNMAVADFDENVSGTLEIVEIDGQITAAFNFTAHSARDETLSIDVNGRVNQVLFNYRPETTLTLSGLIDREFTTLEAFEDDNLTYVWQYKLDDFSNEYRWDSNFRDNDFNFMAEIIFFLKGDIQPGTYDVTYGLPENNKVPDGFEVGARLSYQDNGEGIDFNASTITGTITIAVDERNYASNTFEITGTSDDGETLSATGTFQYFENQFGQAGE